MCARVFIRGGIPCVHVNSANKNRYAYSPVSLLSQLETKP